MDLLSKYSFKLSDTVKNLTKTNLNYTYIYLTRSNDINKYTEIDLSRRIICSTSKSVVTGYMLVGPRHNDSTMLKQLELYTSLMDYMSNNWVHGFIDDLGKFYTRSDAMELVNKSGQHINLEGCVGDKLKLFSGALY